MYAIIKDNQLIWFTDYKPTQKNMSFDKLIEWDFDPQKSWKFENWEVIENIITEIKKTNEEKISEIETKLFDLSKQITWLKQLTENELHTEDDIVLLEKIQLEAKDLAEQRKILKINS